jgi:hypothetical protein
MNMPKFAHLIQPGAVVETIGGGVYRVVSKIASSGEFTFKLADMQGNPVPVPTDFKPVTPALARFAAWMRYVVAYNEDFDTYVKEYIRAAGLPVDHEMNWAKFFQAKIAPKLISHDPGITDEALHQIIIKSLAERKILDSSNPSGFAHAIKKFPASIRNLPLEKQVRAFLVQAFTWRVSEANKYIQTVVFQEGTDSMWETENGEEDGKETNRLDTEELATGLGSYNQIEADVDIAEFRKGFAKFLYKKLRKKTATDLLLIFDLVYEEIKSMGDIPPPREFIPRWIEATGTSKKSLFVRFAELPKLINIYIEHHLNDMDYAVHPILELMRSAAKAQSEVSTPELAKATHASVDDGVPSWEKDKQSAKQWETPKCSICNSTVNPRDCRACKGRFCVEHLQNHFLNNPSHDIITASEKTAYSEGSHSTSKVTLTDAQKELLEVCRLLLSRPIEPDLRPRLLQAVTSVMNGS